MCRLQATSPCRHPGPRHHHLSSGLLPQLPEWFPQYCLCPTIYSQLTSQSNPVKCKVITRFLNLSTVDILDFLLQRVVFCVVGYLAAFLASGLYPLDDSNTPLPPAVTTKNISRYCQMSRGQNHPWLGTSWLLSLFSPKLWSFPISLRVDAIVRVHNSLSVSVGPGHTSPSPVCLTSSASVLPPLCQSSHTGFLLVTSTSGVLC